MTVNDSEMFVRWKDEKKIKNKYQSISIKYHNFSMHHACSGWVIGHHTYTCQASLLIYNYRGVFQLRKQFRDRGRSGVAGSTVPSRVVPGHRIAIGHVTVRPTEEAVEETPDRTRTRCATMDHVQVRGVQVASSCGAAVRRESKSEYRPMLSVGKYGNVSML